MSFHNYDPDDMFPQKEKPQRLVGGWVTRWVIIVLLGLLLIWVGAGCKNIKSFEADFGGLDIEYYPSHPSQEEKSIFDFGMTTTNRINVVPAGWDGPILMPMNRNK